MMEVAKGEVEARALVVHAVDQLQAAHRAGAVEAARVDDLETHARRCHVHPLQRTEALVEAAAGCLADGDDVHAFHGERGLLLLFLDSVAYHIGFLQQGLFHRELALHRKVFLLQ